MNFLKIFGIIAVVLVLAFLLELGGLQWTKFFAPKRENIKREVFENTKSFTYGKIQDLAKYYKEYNETDNIEDKTTISNLVKMNFNNFDEKKINNDTLRNFLIRERGY